MNIHTTHPVIKVLTAILLIGAFVFAVGHTLDHVDHDVQCVVCGWASGLLALVCAFLFSQLRYTTKFHFFSTRYFLPSSFFFFSLGRSPPSVS